MAGDFNGDGKDDIASLYDYGDSHMTIQVFLSSGSSFAGWQSWLDLYAYSAEKITGRVVAGDFNADGKDDIAALYDYGGGTCQMHVFLTNSAGTEVEGGYWQTWYACTTAGYYYANQVTGRMVAGDFNGDGKDDIAAMYDYGDNKAQIHYLLTNSTGSGFDSTAWHVSEMNTNYNAALVQWRMVSGDYDGDGKDDIAALYDYTYYDATDSGQVQVFRSTGTDFASKEWWYYGGKRAYDASKTAGLVSADYNGDGKAEIHALYDMGSGQANVYEFRKKEDFALDRFALVTDAWNSYAVLVEDENAASGLLESVTNGTNAAIRYTYDGNGNITEIREGTQLKARYAYDSLNQLIREDNAYTGKTVTYTYDAGGNILGKTEYTYTTGELGSPTRSVVYGYTDSTWKDLLTSYDGTAITYDEIGNPLNWRGGMSFTWQNGRQLAGISKDGLTASYAYNDSGIRLRKTVNGVTTQYYLNGSLILSEVTGNVQTDYYYDESGNVFGFKRGDSEYYYIRNGQGDIIGILDSSGTQIVSYVYDSWGKLVSISGSQAETIGETNPFRYRGYYYDTESGLYYLQSRYYDPEVGRFLNADSAIGVNGDIHAYNLFAYCKNGPVSLQKSVTTEKNNALVEKAIIPNFYIPGFNASEIKIPVITEIAVRYSIPLYDQKSYSLCWAFCQVMVEDFRAGRTQTNAQATARAIEIAIGYHGASGIDDRATWDQGGWPTNCYNLFGETGIENINDLYKAVVNRGPLYAYYGGDSGAHLVVVTGVNLTKGMVYTNNPWGISGEQTYSEFLNGFAGMPSDWDMPFGFYIYIQ